MSKSWDFNIIEVMQLFAIYSAGGWILDNIYCLLKDKHRFDRGLFRGPYMPIYGVMMLLCLFATYELTEDLEYMLLLIFTIATLVELFAGILVHIVTANRYWNYSGRFLNIHGYTCFVHSLKVTIFLAGCLVLVQPIIIELINVIPPWVDFLFLVSFYMYFAADLVDTIAEAFFMRKFMKQDVKIYKKNKTKKVLK
ncbi:hypothetical protein ACGCUQ_07560 [Eubacteriales bacterium KG127]